VRLPDLSTRLAEVVVKATAQNPAHRHATADELGAALGACLSDAHGRSKQRDVTAALAELIVDGADAGSGAWSPPRGVAVEAVPTPIVEPGYDDYAVGELTRPSARITLRDSGRSDRRFPTQY